MLGIYERAYGFKHHRKKKPYVEQSLQEMRLLCRAFCRLKAGPPARPGSVEAYLEVQG